MSHEQIKGTFLAIGATAASTALLVGGGFQMERREPVS